MTFFIFLFILLFPSFVWAAIDCTDENIVTEYEALPAEGGTITCNAGTFTFNALVTFSTKPTKLVGAGIGVTILNMTNALSFDSSGSVAHEVSDMTMNASHAAGGYAISAIGDSTGSIYVHDIQFYTTNYYTIRAYNSGNLLVSKCSFGDNSTRSANEPFWIISLDDQLGTVKKAVGFGSSWPTDSNIQWTVIEGNTFWMRAGDYPSGQAIWDSKWAGKALLRYNTIYNGYIITHGPCAAVILNFGPYAQEIYNNLWIMEDGSGTYRWNQWNDGGIWTMMVHNNRMEQRGTGHWDGMINYEAGRDDDTNSACEGGMMPHIVDTNIMACSGSTATSLYLCSAVSDLCADNGKGTCNRKFCSNSLTLCDGDEDCGGGTCNRYMDNSDGSAYFAAIGAGKLTTSGEPITPEPAYYWNNYKYFCDADYPNSGSCWGQTEVKLSETNLSTYILLGTHFKNTAKDLYSPYTCPHPLTGPGKKCGTGAGVAYYGIQDRIYGPIRIYMKGPPEP